MYWTNYHSHTHFSDGKGEPELYVESAIKNGLYAYGFSCHSPVPFDSGWNMKYEKLAAYINEIKLLKEKYKNEIKLFLGMEVDYIKNLSGIKQYENIGLDYTIGGVHFLGQFENGRFWDFDGGKPWFTKGLNELFDGDIKKLVTFYYQQIVDMAIEEKPDIIAHFDLIKKYNKGSYFFSENEDWYKKIALEALEKIAKTDSIIEINTRGILKKLNEEFYPSNFILKRCEELSIPICLSADTHHPDDVKAFLPEAMELLKSIGFKEVRYFDENGWVAQTI